MTDKSTRDGALKSHPSSLFLNWNLNEQEKEKSLLLALSYKLTPKVLYERGVFLVSLLENS